MGPRISQWLGQEPKVMSGFEMSTDRPNCAQCYQVNDKSLRNMFALRAALDASVVCIVKLSREKSFNAATDLIQKVN